MRKTGVEQLEALEKSTNPSKRKWIFAAFALLLIGAATSIAWQMSRPEALLEQAPARALDAELLGRYLQREGVSEAEMGKWFEISAADASLFTAQGGDPQSRVTSVMAAIFNNDLIEVFIPDDGLDRRLFSPKKLCSRIAAEQKTVVVSIEVASLMVAAVRAQDTDAVLAEVWNRPGLTTPLDPTGMLGYYAVALNDAEPDQPSVIFDVAQNRRYEPSEVSYRQLTDVQSIAAVLATNAFVRLTTDFDPAGARLDANRSKTLDPRSPIIRSLLTMIALQSGDIQDAQAQADAAIQLRDDAPQLANAAELLLTQAMMAGAAGDREAFDDATQRTSAMLTRALSKSPDYVRGRIGMAGMFMVSGDIDRARAELQHAESLAPHSMQVDVGWAQFYSATGEPEKAIIKIDEAIAGAPGDFRLYLQAAPIYRAAGDYDAMQRAYQTALEKAPESARENLRKTIVEAAGADVLDAADDDTERGDEPPASDEPAFKLNDPSTLQLEKRADDFDLQLPR